MSIIPEPTVSASAAIDAHHEQQASRQRAHMGLSGAGNRDARALWLSHRWAFEVVLPGRVLRLFRRGHHEEYTVVSDLRAIGCHLEYVLGDQMRLDLGDHVSGSPDGIIVSGLPEAPKTPHLLEIKTISKKRFDDLNKNGVEKSNPMYWAQVHAYMQAINALQAVPYRIERCFFIAVCKDDDAIYTERIRLDADFGAAAINRLQDIAISDRIPEPTYTDPTYFEAKWSDYYAVYFPRSATSRNWARLKVQREHENPVAARICRNCRTCKHSRPLTDDSEWACTKHGDGVIPLEFQRTGCDDWTLHDDLMELCADAEATP